MKIIIYCLNFKPEIVGTGKYNGELADYLYRRGYEIRVITAPRYYPEWETSHNNYHIEKNSEYKIFRCPLYLPKSLNGLKRILHLFSFSFTSLPVLLMQLRWRPDCILFVSPTLFCVPNIFIFKFLSKRKIFSILQIKDFELDAAFNLGILRGKYFKFLLEQIEIQFLKSFEIVGTISQGMIKKLSLKGIPRKKIFFFPDWVDVNEIKQRKSNENVNNIYRKKLKISSEKIIIQYSGTMNKKQGFSFLIPIIEKLKHKKNILWLFGGEGPTKNQLIKATQNIPNIKFLGFQKASNMNDWINTGDIHIIPQSEDVEDLLFPSKLLAILASGNPVVSNASLNSELGKLVKDIGIRVDPSDDSGFIKALIKLIDNKELRLNLGAKSRKIAEKSYDKIKILRGFEKTLNFNYIKFLKC